MLFGTMNKIENKIYMSFMPTVMRALTPERDYRKNNSNYNIVKYFNYSSEIKKNNFFNINVIMKSQNLRVPFKK